MSIKLNKSQGISLVELMIGLLVASLISTSVYYLYGSGLKTFYQVNDTSELQDESNVIFSMIERDIARGGFVHPIRGDITDEDNCIAVIDPEDAVEVVSGNEISACFDKPNYDGTKAYRYKITYKKGNGTIGLEDTKTLYKKIVRTNDCSGTDTIDTSLEPNFASTTHDEWLPVSKNINTINFAKAIINTNQKEDIVNININFSSRNNEEYNFDFKKRIFLRNRSVIVNAGNCDEKCPNSKKIFSDYVMSENISFWNPEVKNIPSARIIIQDGFDSTEDELKWDTELETRYGLVANYEPSTGVLSITGSANGDEYEDFINNVTYVNTETDPNDRDDSNDPDRRLVLALGSDVCSPVPREVGTNFHFYCFQERTSGGSSSWDGGSGNHGMSTNGWYWWGEAEAEAESERYYNLKGYLATITNADENNYVKDRIRKSDNTIPAGWIGGSDIQSEGTWRWMGGPEDGQIFFSDNNNCNDDAWVIPWAGHCNWSEPNNNMGAPWWSSESARGSSRGYSCALGSGHCCGRPNGMSNNNVCDGEHYTQYKTDGDWNDLFLPGYRHGVYKTDGYVLEFSTNFVTTNTCGNTNDDQRAACVNYLLSKEIVLKDFTYQDEDMLDLCDTSA